MVTPCLEVPRDTVVVAVYSEEKNYLFKKTVLVLQPVQSFCKEMILKLLLFFCFVLLFYFVYSKLNKRTADRRKEGVRNTKVKTW